MLLYLRKKYFTEFEHGYVYITKHRYVIRRCCLLWKTLVEHPTSGASEVRPVGLNNNISDRSETKGTGILSDLLVRNRR